MKDRIDYIMTDARCEIALDTFKTGIPNHSWITEHLSLFALISIRHNNGQTISDSDHQGEHFEFIYRFHELFRKILDEAEELF